MSESEFGLSERTVGEIRTIFSNYQQVDKAIVYGSRAMGNFKVGSDIDIALMGDSLDLSVLQHIAGQFEDSSIPYKVDLLIFNLVDHVELRDHIERVGKALYCRIASLQ